MVAKYQRLCYVKEGKGAVTDALCRFLDVVGGGSTEKIARSGVEHGSWKYAGPSLASSQPQKADASASRFRVLRTGVRDNPGPTAG